MAKGKAASSSESLRTTKPALTPEARENQLIALATDLVEQRLRNGTASSQETVHFLKLGTQKAKLEQEILKEQKDLIKAKTDSLKSAQRMEALYTEAMEAMRRYSGIGDGND